MNQYKGIYTYNKCMMYEEIISNIEELGWSNVLKKGQFSITHNNVSMVTTKVVTSGSWGNFLEIECPAEHMIVICGNNQCNNAYESIKYPNISKNPHSLTIKCTTKKNIELSSNTIISIYKEEFDMERVILCKEHYDRLSQLSLITLGNNVRSVHTEEMVKKHKHGYYQEYDRRYHFRDTVILHYGQRLVFSVRLPDIDIVNTKILMELDMFVREQ